MAAWQLLIVSLPTRHTTERMPRSIIRPLKSLTGLAYELAKSIMT